jgi:hypothetical protein
VAEQSSGPKSPFGDSTSIDQMIESYLGVIRGVLDKLPATSDPNEVDAKLDGNEQQVFLHLARAQMTMMSRGLNLWRQVGETMLNHGIEATNAAPKDMSDPKARDHMRMIALDKARACLREIGDLSRVNAEEFQHELIEIEAALRASQSPEPYDKPKRQARAKR